MSRNAPRLGLPFYVHGNARAPRCIQSAAYAAATAACNRRTAMRIPALVATAAVFAACTTAQLPFTAGVGPDPQLPPAQKELIPTVKVAKAIGWTGGAKPTPAQGMT